MAQTECPYCRAPNTLPISWILARRCAIAALVTFWIGLLAMLVLNLLGMARVGGWVWLACTVAPLLVFLAEHAWLVRDPTYRDGRQCPRCGRRWVAGNEPSLVAAESAARAPATDERLRWLERQRRKPML